MIQLSQRLSQLPPYLFAELNRRAEKARRRGVDVINLAAGDPDLPPLPHVLEALGRAVRDPMAHRYPPYDGTDELRAAGARYYRRRFGVQLDPDGEVLVLIGAKEGLVHAAHAILNPDDVALVPDPGYPVYSYQARLCGAAVRSVPARSEIGWQVDLNSVDPTGSRLLFLNYPANPTGAVATLTHLSDAVDFCRQHEIILVHDLAYAETTFDGHVAPSVLQVPGARDFSVEVFSLSKSFRMAGLRVGLAVGNAEIIAAIRTLKSHADTGQFRALQTAAIAALDGLQDHLDEDRRLYQGRRDLVVAGLRKAGLDPNSPKGALYVWAKIPLGQTAQAFSDRALESVGVLLAPGTGYGARGEGYVRVALTCPDSRLAQACARLEGLR